MILAIWFFLALVASLTGIFRGATAPMVAGTVWGLTGLALLVCRINSSVRQWVTTADLRWLVAPHLLRFVGIYFLMLEHRGELPAEFARPAGIGDIITAMGAAAILLSPALRNRAFLLIWNTLGLIDIVLVVFLALRCGLRDWASMAALRELPLSLLPALIVPLIIASHALIFIRLARSQSVR